MNDNNKYFYQSTYSYNTFGADEHIVVTLYKYKAKNDKYVFVRRWSYSTFMKEWLANSLAERRMIRLQAAYGAKPL
jgi:hypothetical protein